VGPLPPLGAAVQPPLEVAVGALHADPNAPLLFNLKGSGASVVVRAPTGEERRFELLLEGAAGKGGGRGSGGGSAEAGSGGSAGSSVLGGLFGSMLGGIMEGVGVGGGAGRRGGSQCTIPLRVEVGLAPRSRRCTVRMGCGIGGGGIVWVPHAFFTHRFSSSQEEQQAAASHVGWIARARELGCSIDTLCDHPRIAPLWDLLGTVRGPLRFEVRRLAFLRRGLLDEIKAAMAALAALSSSEGGVAGDGGMEGGGATGLSSSSAAQCAGTSAALGKVRDDVGALSLRAGGSGGDAPHPAAPSIANGGTHEAHAAAYREAFINAALCSSSAAQEEEREAAEESARARGRGFGLPFPLSLDPRDLTSALACLSAESEALFQGAKLALREKQECLKAHFAATTPRSRIEDLPRWVQDAVQCTGEALFSELDALCIERSDGIPLLTS
jgi:hypothetical protein